MNKEAQRIAIAEACGWKRFSCSETHDIGWIHPDGHRLTLHCLPNYLNDLNAMHAAEGVMSGDWRLWDGYRIALEEMVGREDTFHATAAQRAEAFLRTIGKWEEAA